MKMKMKNRSHRYDKNRPRSRHGHKYSKEKMCLDMIMFICINQHLSNIWSSIREKVKQNWSWVEKRVAYKKKHVSTMDKRFLHNFTFFMRLPLLSLFFFFFFFFVLVKYSENLNSDPYFQFFHTDIDIRSCILILIFNNLSRH